MRFILLQHLFYFIAYETTPLTHHTCFESTGKVKLGFLCHQILLQNKQSKLAEASRRQLWRLVTSR